MNHKYHPYSLPSDQNRHGYYQVNHVPITHQHITRPTVHTSPPPSLPPMQPQVQAIQPQVYYQPYPPQQYYTYVQPQGDALPSNRHRKTKHFSTWTPAEDKLLRELKEEQKMGWKQILTYLNDRTPNACQFRWRRVVGSINVASSSTSTLPPNSPKETSSRSHSLTHITSPNSSPMTSPTLSNLEAAESPEPKEQIENSNEFNATNATHSAGGSLNSSPASHRRRSSQHSINFLLN